MKRGTKVVKQSGGGKSNNVVAVPLHNSIYYFLSKKNKELYLVFITVNQSRV